MQLEDLKAQYDQLQLQYGAKELTSIYNGGYTDNPVYYPIGNGISSLLSYWKWNDEYRKSNRKYEIYCKTN